MKNSGRDGIDTELLARHEALEVKVWVQGSSRCKDKRMRSASLCPVHRGAAVGAEAGKMDRVQATRVCEARPSWMQGPRQDVT